MSGTRQNAQGKRIKIKGFKDRKVRLFQVEVSTHRTGLIVTNDSTQIDRGYPKGRVASVGRLSNCTVKGPSIESILNDASVAKPIFNTNHIAWIPGLGNRRLVDGNRKTVTNQTGVTSIIP